MTTYAINNLLELDSIADFKKLWLSQRADERTILFGFSVCLFYEEGSRFERRLNGNNVVADYRNLFRNEITHFFPAGSRHLRKIDKVDPLEYYNKLAAKATAEEAVEASLFGYLSGKDEAGAAPYYVDNVGQSHFKLWSRALGYFPAAWIATNGYPAFLETTLRWCNLLKPGHGTAGLSLILDEGSAKAPQSRLAFPVIKRFPGIDFPDLGAWSSEVRHEKKRWIRTVSWLTILDDGFVGELGGLEKMKAELGDDCHIHVWNGGVIIQAGPEPEVGDVNQGLIPEAYRKVARLTKPLRFENLKGRISLLNPPPPLDHIEESLKWIRRFD
jgi:Protein of unknown function (DUF3396)